MKKRSLNGENNFCLGREKKISSIDWETQFDTRRRKGRIEEEIERVEQKERNDIVHVISIRKR